jgi:ribosomal protein L16 Arg81 hydroxylase
MQSATPQGLFGILFRHVGWRTFLSEYWAQKPLHVQDCRELTGVLPGLSDFPALVAGSLNAERWEQMSADIHCSFVDQNSTVRSMRVPGGQWAHAYNAGLSLCFGGVDRWHAKLRELVDDCRRSTPHTGEIYVTAYCTPKRSGGPMHFDSQHVFFLQVAGEKHWRISQAPAAVDPLRNVTASAFPSGKARLKEWGVEARHPDACEMADVVLREGEALYLPPGTWHEPRTKDSASLHYSLTLTPVSFGTMIAPQLLKYLSEHPAWRTDLRYLEGEGAMEEFLTERLEEMRALLERLMAPELIDMWSRPTQK